MQGRLNASRLAAVVTLVLSGAGAGSTPAGPATQTRQDAPLPYGGVVDSITYPPSRGAGWVWCTGTPEAARYCFDPHDSTVVRWYALRADPDTTVTLTVSSADFDVRMALLAEGGGRTVNDDGAGACDARIRRRELSRDTLYVLVVGQHLRTPGRFSIDLTASDSASNAVWDTSRCVTDRVTPQPHSFVPMPSAGLHTLTVGLDSLSVALDSRTAPLSGSARVVTQGTLVVSASLTPYDGRLGEAGNAQLWRLAVTERVDKLDIVMASRDFTPHMYLIGPKTAQARRGTSDGDSCSTATLRVTDLPSGHYRIVLSGVQPSATGGFSLTLGPPGIVASCPPRGALVQLSAGQSATLPPPRSASPRLSRTAVLTGRPGASATVVVRGTGTVRRFIYLSHGGVVDTARVEPSLCAGRLSFTFPPDGVARLDVSDSAGAPTDSLAVRVESGQGLEPDTAPSECGDVIARVTTDSALNEPVGAPLPDSPYVVEIRSRDIDPVARLIRANGDTLTDDNGGSWCNAKLTIHQPTPGDRLLVADASGTVAHAAYHMRFDPIAQPSAPPDTCRSPRLPASAARLRTRLFGSLALLQPIPGALSAEAQLSDSTYAARWAVARDTARTGKWLVLESVKAEFDPYLWIVGKDFILGDDNGGPGCSAALPAPPDSMDIVVNATTPKTGGEYLLRLRDSVPPDTPCLTGRYYAVDQLPAVDTLVLPAADSIVRYGTLTVSDARLLEDTTWAQAVVLRVGSSIGRRRLVFRLDSPAFDPWLIVTGPDGSTRENDDGGDGYNSHIEWPDAPPGEYRIVVNSWGRDDEGLGAYTLRVLSAR